MSQYGQKVTAVIDTTSAFGVTIKDLYSNQQALQNSMNILLNDAPESLDTLNELAAAIQDDPSFFSNMASANTTLQNNIDALQTAASNARAALQALLQANIDGKLDLAGGTLTGSLTVHRQFPDFHLKSNEEKRVLFTDAGGGATGAIKNVDSELDFFAGGVTASDKKFSVGTNKVESLANLLVKKSFPDLELSAGDEKRVLFSDAGGGATGAIKNVDSDLDFFAGGVTASDKKFTVGANKVQALTNLSVKKNFPDVELSSGDEKRILFTDAGGSATGAIKHTSSSLDFYASGIAAGNKEMTVSQDGVDVSSLKINGTSVTATATQINGWEARIAALEAQLTLLQD